MAVSKGFRSQLWYRLNGIEAVLAPTLMILKLRALYVDKMRAYRTMKVVVVTRTSKLLNIAALRPLKRIEDILLGIAEVQDSVQLCQSCGAWPPPDILFQKFRFKSSDLFRLSNLLGASQTGSNFQASGCAHQCIEAAGGS